MERYVDTLLGGRIPRRAPALLYARLNSMLVPCAHPQCNALRFHAACDRLRAQGNFTLVDRQWTRALSQWLGGRRVLEVMAGSGMLAKALCAHGARVRATDSLVDGYRRQWDVEPAGAREAIARYPDAEVLLMAWPPIETSDAAEALSAWGPGRPVAFLGEGPGGCVADARFYARFACGGRLPIRTPTLPGLHDALYAGRVRRAQGVSPPKGVEQPRAGGAAIEAPVPG